MANTTQGDGNRTIIIPPGSLNPDEVNVVYIPPSLHNTNHPLLVRPASGGDRHFQAFPLPIWDDELSRRDEGNDTQNSVVTQENRSIPGDSGYEADISAFGTTMAESSVHTTGYLADVSYMDNVEYKKMCSNVTAGGGRSPSVTQMTSRSLKTSSEAPAEGHSISINAPGGMSPAAFERILQENLSAKENTSPGSSSSCPPCGSADEDDNLNISGFQNATFAPAGSGSQPGNATYAPAAANATYAPEEDDCICPGDDLDYDYFDPTHISSFRSLTPESFYDELVDSDWYDSDQMPSSGEMDESAFARVMGGEYNVISPMTPSPTKPATAPCPQKCASWQNVGNKCYTAPDRRSRPMNATYPYEGAGRGSQRANATCPPGLCAPGNMIPPLGNAPYAPSALSKPVSQAPADRWSRSMNATYPYDAAGGGGAQRMNASCPPGRTGASNAPAQRNQTSAASGSAPCNAKATQGNVTSALGSAPYAPSALSKPVSQAPTDRWSRSMNATYPYHTAGGEGAQRMNASCPPGLCAPGNMIPPLGNMPYAPSALSKPVSQAPGDRWSRSMNATYPYDAAGGGGAQRMNASYPPGRTGASNAPAQRNQTSAASGSAPCNAKATQGNVTSALGSAPYAPSALSKPVSQAPTDRWSRSMNATYPYHAAGGGGAQRMNASCPPGLCAPGNMIPPLGNAPYAPSALSKPVSQAPADRWSRSMNATYPLDAAGGEGAQRINASCPPGLAGGNRNITGPGLSSSCPPTCGSADEDDNLNISGFQPAFHSSMQELLPESYYADMYDKTSEPYDSNQWPLTTVDVDESSFGPSNTFPFEYGRTKLPNKTYHGCPQPWRRAQGQAQPLPPNATFVAPGPAPNASTAGCRPQQPANATFAPAGSGSQPGNATYAPAAANATFAPGGANATYAPEEDDCICPGDDLDYDYFDPTHISSFRSLTPESFYDDLVDSDWYDSDQMPSSGEMDESAFARVMGGEYNVISPMTPSPTKPATALAPHAQSAPDRRSRPMNATYPYEGTGRGSQRANATCPPGLCAPGNMIPPLGNVPYAPSALSKPVSQAPADRWSRSMNATYPYDAAGGGGRSQRMNASCPPALAGASTARREPQQPVNATFAGYGAQPGNATFAPGGANATYAPTKLAASQGSQCGAPQGDRSAQRINATRTGSPGNATFGGTGQTNSWFNATDPISSTDIACGCDNL